VLCDGSWFLAYPTQNKAFLFLALLTNR
jgi:hypothetical protein